MRFTTLSFLIFFLILYLAYWSVSSRKRPVLLFLASFLFYAAWSVPFALHFLALIAINHLLIERMQKSRSRQLLYLILGIDLANLFLFKYFYLFIKLLFDLTGIAFFSATHFNAWLEGALGAPSIILPLAISFYTFQIVAYAMDVYRKKIKEHHSFLRFSVFIMFFPQLVAGPIMRESDFFWQFDQVKPDAKNAKAGLALLAIGLIKKVVLADNLIAGVNAVFINPDAYDWQSQVLAGLGYTIRVYSDFSGYTDIARGMGLLLGFDLPENFRGPYLSTSFRELWQRWHITLSTWLRDYLFIPLGGSRGSALRTQINLAITFTLGGLWHGANYTFFVWGALHGTLLALERPLRALKTRLPVPGWLDKTLLLPRIIITFGAFWAGAIIFNAPQITNAWTMFARMAGGAPGLKGPDNELVLNLLPVCLLLNFLQYRPQILERFWKLAGIWQILLLGLLGLITMALLGRFAPGGNDFIYFQF